jgi:hypothetical protein
VDAVDDDGTGVESDERDECGGAVAGEGMTTAARMRRCGRV